MYHCFISNEITLLAGIYLHIPFCKQACHYCDFHFSTSLKLKDSIITSICKEIELQQSFAKNDQISTIYLGGGTPSLLNATELNRIFNQIYKCFNVYTNVEITIEANPDDLNFSYLYSLKKETPINRLSIGIQSFYNEDLKAMNRAHDAKDSKSVISKAQDIGFNNISADLIFGTHTMSLDRWKNNLKMMLNFKIPHISIYGLTVEPKTAWEHFIKTGKYPKLNDKTFEEQFLMTQQILTEAGFRQYEISNYAQEGGHSKHNSSYWNGSEYLGIGPSSHSYYDGKRYWNLNNNTQYLKALSQNKIPSTEEVLSERDRYNEFIMTQLRLINGLSKTSLKVFDKKYQDYFNQEIKSLLLAKEILESPTHFWIPSEKRILTDRISQALFYVD